MNKLFSFLLPTRGRAKTYLPACVNSIVNTANDISKIEILVRIDDDDVETIDNIENILSKVSHKIIIGKRGNGYKDIYLYQNSLAAISSGQFLVIWNDDILILNGDWDICFERRFKDKYIVAMPFEINHNKYVYWHPFFHRKFYELMGRVSNYSQTDEWFKALEEISLAEDNIKIYRNFEEMKITHLFIKNDETGSEVAYSSMSLDNIEEHKKDGIKIRNFFKDLKENNPEEFTYGGYYCGNV